MRIGDLMSRATNDLSAVRMVLGPGIMYTASTLATFVGTIALMVTISPWLLGAVAGAAALRHRPGALLRPPHPRPLRGGAGAAQQHERARAGEPLGGARGARLRAGGPRDGALRGRQRGVPEAQPPAHPDVRQPVPRHPAPDGDERRLRALAGRPHGGRGRHHPRRVRGLRRLPRHAALADDRAGLGGEPLRARRGLDGPAARDPGRAAGDRRRRGAWTSPPCAGTCASAA